LTKFFTDSTGMRFPVVSAYGGFWTTPRYPEAEDGWALTLIDMTTAQIEASMDDPGIIMMPQLFSSQNVPDSAVAAYSSWGVTSGMTLGDFLLKLAETEPGFEINAQR
jgi:hypothetical protein